MIVAEPGAVSESLVNGSPGSGIAARVGNARGRRPIRPAPSPLL